MDPRRTRDGGVALGGGLALCLPLCLLVCVTLSVDEACAQVSEGTTIGSDTGFGDSFANSAALSADTAVLGARQHGGVGAAYVIRRGPIGVWSEEAKLTAPGAQPGDQVGASVSVDVDTCIVGAPDPFDPFGFAAGPGSAYVYRRSGASWVHQATLTAGDGQSTDQFGHAVSVAGDVAIIGARGDEPGGVGSRFGGVGAAYVYLRTGAVWQQDFKIVPAGSAAADRVGEAVSVHNGLVVIGAPGDDDLGSESGSAYSYHPQGGIWIQDGKLLASDGAAGDEFGHSIVRSGSLVAIGAPGHDAGASDAGAVYLFRFNAGWSQEAKLVASDASMDARFGVSVSASGERVLVGASGVSNVYLFEHQGGGVWTEITGLTEAGAVGLGYAAGVDGDFAVGGDPLESFTGRASFWCVAPGPVLSSLNPVSAPYNQATPVTLAGANFSSTKAISVTFGGIPATGVTFVSDTQVTCVAPGGAPNQTVDVVVDQGGQSDLLANAFTYLGADLQSIQPVSGPSAGGNAVTLSGAQFDAATTVTFGGVPASVQSFNPASIVVIAPVGTPGASVDVAVSGPSGADVLINAYTYETFSVLSVSPPAGNLVGGTAVTVTVANGTNVADTTVTLGGVPMTVLTANSTTVTFVTPPVVEPPGGGSDVVVTNSNGSDTEAGGFTYTPSLVIGVAGDVINGGSLDIVWVTDPAAPGPQAITLWVGNPAMAPQNGKVYGYAGRIQWVPLLFILQGFPAGIGGINLPFNPLPVTISGFPLNMEAVVTGEGGVLGSFTNAAPFVIP